MSRSGFISKLHQLLDEPFDSSRLRWIGDDTFEILDDESALHALSPAFDFRLLSSFLRQCSYYSFVRLSDRRRSRSALGSVPYIVYTHPSGLFVRGDSSRLNGIVRKRRPLPGKEGNSRARRMLSPTQSVSPRRVSHISPDEILPRRRRQPSSPRPHSPTYTLAKGSKWSPELTQREDLPEIGRWGREENDPYLRRTAMESYSMSESPPSGPLSYPTPPITYSPRRSPVGNNYPFTSVGSHLPMSPHLSHYQYPHLQMGNRNTSPYHHRSYVDSFAMLNDRSACFRNDVRLNFGPNALQLDID